MHVTREMSDELEVAFIASHFSETSNLEHLDIHTLRRILSYLSLRLEREDSLYRFVCTLIARDRSYCELLDLVTF